MPGADCIDREGTAVDLQGVPATAVKGTVDIRGLVIILFGIHNRVVIILFGMNNEKCCKQI